MNQLLLRAVDKILSGRWIVLILLVGTACVGFLKDKLSEEFFAGIVAGALTGYQLKGRSDVIQSSDKK